MTSDLKFIDKKAAKIHSQISALIVEVGRYAYDRRSCRQLIDIEFPNHDADYQRCINALTSALGWFDDATVDIRDKK